MVGMAASASALVASCGGGGHGCGGCGDGDARSVAGRNCGGREPDWGIHAVFLERMLRRSSGARGSARSCEAAAAPVVHRRQG
eukprot:3911625-Pleurochrysis_carterae.AAC.2